MTIHESQNTLSLPQQVYLNAFTDQELLLWFCYNSYPDANPCDSMLGQLFHEKNRNRSLPCVQVIFNGHT